MNILTINLLNKLNACKEGVKWATDNKLIGIPFDIIHQIEGDCEEGYIGWVKTQIINADIKFDDQGNLISHTIYNSFIPFHQWYEYDDRNNLICHGNSTNYRIDYKYDDRNNLIEIKDNKNSYKREYDDRNNLICSRRQDGETKNYKYDARNNVIRFEMNGNHYIYWKEYEYDDKNNLIHFKDSAKYEYWQEFNSENFRIKFIMKGRGNSSLYEYDDRGNEIYTKTPNTIILRKFDQNNNLIELTYDHLDVGRVSTEKYISEIYDDGQLKRYDDLIIPYFNKDII